jgi:hypothetical protein
VNSNRFYVIHPETTLYLSLFVAIAIEAFNKLATLEEEQNPGVGRHLSDHRPITVAKVNS